MKKTAVVLLTLLVAIAAIGLPIWLAIAEAQRQALKAESAHALGYARDVVMRVNETGRQVQAGVARLAAHGDAPCAPASIDVMREIDLGSTYVQAVGYIEGDRMLCSSIVGATSALELGPPDYVGPQGDIVRKDARFPFAPQQNFLVLQFGHFAGILHSQLAIDTAKSEPDVSLAVMSQALAEPVSSRGQVDPAWLKRLGNERERVFVEGGQLVAMVRSPESGLIGIAALPLRYLEGRSQEVAMRLLPAGVAAGVALALAILYLGRQQMALPTAVKAALRRKEFFLEYQPLVELRSGRWIGVEALVRWRRSTGETVMPDLFIPIAERNDMIVRLTRQVLELVCRDTGFYLEAHPDFHIGINVAPANFHSPGFLGSLQRTLRHMGGGRPASSWK